MICTHKNWPKTFSKVKNCNIFLLVVSSPGQMKPSCWLCMKLCTLIATSSLCWLRWAAWFHGCPTQEPWKFNWNYSENCKERSSSLHVSALKHLAAFYVLSRYFPQHLAVVAVFASDSLPWVLTCWPFPQQSHPEIEIAATPTTPTATTPTTPLGTTPPSLDSEFSVNLKTKVLYLCKYFILSRSGISDC